MRKYVLVVIRPFAVFLIRLLIMWIPEFLMVIRSGGRAGGGGVMSRVGNDRGGGNLTGGEEAEGEKSGGKAPGGRRRGGDRLIPSSVTNI